jgi:hypothetical protein
MVPERIFTMFTTAQQWTLLLQLLLLAKRPFFVLQGDPMYLSIYGSTALCWTFYTVGRTPWTGDQTFARPLPAHRTAQTQNKRIRTCMGFEPTIPMFEWAKTVHALDRAATVIDKAWRSFLSTVNPF